MYACCDLNAKKFVFNVYFLENDARNRFVHKEPLTILVKLVIL